MAEDRLVGAVASQVDWWWKRLFRPRLTGLTDDELWWEPVDGAWTLHPSPEDGRYRYEWPPGSLGETTPPFTTMAWRLCHLTLSAMAQWALAYEGDSEGVAHSGELDFPPAADDAVALVEHWWQRWRAGLGGLDDGALLAPISSSAFQVDAPAMLLGRGDPLLHHVLHQQRELIHHGAEVNLLRDLYRAGGRAGTEPWV